MRNYTTLNKFLKGEISEIPRKLDNIKDMILGLYELMEEHDTKLNISDISDFRKKYIYLKI